MSIPAPDAPSALLADAARAGVHPLPSGGAEPLLAAAEALGYCTRGIDLSDCADKPELLRRFADALDFPAWFGHNWDALADCLGDLSWMPAPGYVLLLRRTADARDRRAGDFGTALDILDEASRTWAGRGVPFWIFLDAAERADEP